VAGVDTIERAGAALAGAETAEDVAAVLGTVEGDDGGSLVVRPSDPALTGASVVRAPDGRRPNHVELTLAEPLPLSAFKERFGDGKELPLLHPSPARRWLFRLDPGGGRYSLAVLPSVENDSVGSVTLRRDER
jgi:hypothetical protein